MSARRWAVPARQGTGYRSPGLGAGGPAFGRTSLRCSGVGPAAETRYAPAALRRSLRSDSRRQVRNWMRAARAAPRPALLGAGKAPRRTIPRPLPGWRHRKPGPGCAGRGAVRPTPEASGSTGDNAPRSPEVRGLGAGPSEPASSSTARVARARSAPPGNLTSARPVRAQRTKRSEGSAASCAPGPRGRAAQSSPAAGWTAGSPGPCPGPPDS